MFQFTMDNVVRGLVVGGLEHRCLPTSTGLLTLETIERIANILRIFFQKSNF
jgi:hypothetical protein